MWEVENLTPFADERAWVRSYDGSEIWLVVVKATFDVLKDGSTEVSAVQAPVLRSPEHFGEPTKSSVKYDTDLVLAKRGTDVIVVGQAHAPRGHRVTQLDCGIEVGELRKLLRVFGPRVWESGGPSSPATFASMPLVWERAYGGADDAGADPAGIDPYPDNPVGCGFAASRASADGRMLPNIERPAELLSSWRDRPTPAGFGVVASWWRARAVHAGTFDENWSTTRRPLLPVDFDERFFQSAPADQQIAGFLQGGETVRVQGMHPDGTPPFRLPKFRLLLESNFYDGSLEKHPPPRMHTLILEPEESRFSMVWHSALPCHTKGDLLDRTVISLQDDESLDIALGGDGSGKALRR